MKQHRYRITVEHLCDATGTPVPDTPVLRFEARNHDDILSIVERMRQRGEFPSDTAAAFAVGLKLFGEVMLENKENPLFVAFRPHFAEFMKHLKSGPAQPTQTGV